MTNLMHKLFIYLSIYFCLTCFGLSLSPSSEADVQIRRWFYSAVYVVSACPDAETIQSRIEPMANFVHLPLKMGLKKGRNM
jgi:hypothetical protein